MKNQQFLLLMLAISFEISGGNAMAWDESKFKMPSKTELEKLLTPEQRKVTQSCGTERAFQNEYWDNKKPGIYVDVVSGEPLFSSLDKYDSGSGWPSFTKPIRGRTLVNKEDTTLGMTRTEVKSKLADSHLGHVFDDGPGPDHKRFCINSAALKFIPVDDLEAKGYGEYLEDFKKGAGDSKKTAAPKKDTSPKSGHK
ncbi:MAG: peptide-methionine (R)-S-oxide reductase MsrB [Bdellovibrionales bacterium]|nr:peptide-methionine (R)-S-oxide reductase MsrB [Bdellovibrionales bacterium]